MRNRRANLPRGVTSSEASSPAIGQPFGEQAVGQITGWKEKRSRGQRVLNGVSGVRAGGCVQAASKSSNKASFENGI